MKYVRSASGIKVDTSRVSAVGFHYIETILESTEKEVERFIGKGKTEIFHEEATIDTDLLRAEGEAI